TCNTAEREWSKEREKVRRRSTFEGNQLRHVRPRMMSKHPQPESSSFFSLRQNARLPVDTRALASLSCPKRLSGGPNKRQTSKDSGHQSDRGAIALNSNDKVQIQLLNRSRPCSTAKSRHALFHPSDLVSERVFREGL
ncbi:hypothetical protein M436DRAFT_40119, partial [Aureobasidium namibiae CBS 147.97]